MFLGLDQFYDLLLPLKEVVLLGIEFLKQFA